eukprot:c13063_g2_i1.p1 GENE.c13063_g2_i1~~c13063_g2_i1.p1  ORF type:complete len:633 (+),score=244.18 c13063_g2_i1:12-1910(+)
MADESRLEQSFRFLVSLPDPVVISDVQGIVIFVNDSTCTVFGYTKEELIGQNVKIFCDPETAQHHQVHVTRYASLRVPTVMGVSGREVFGQHKDKHLIPLSLSLTETIIEGQRLFIATFRDLRRQRETEKQLLQSQEIEVSTSAAMDASQKMLKYVENEVRQPLNGIMGMLDLANEDLERLKKKESGEASLTSFQVRPELLHERVNIAKKCAFHLHNLITNFVDIRKIETDILELSYSNVTLGTVVETVMTSIQPLIEDVSDKVTFEFIEGKGFERAFEYVMDLHRVCEILFHLIGNGLKYTDKGKVSFIISVSREFGSDESVIRFEVKDTGKGIEPSILSKVFPSYQKASETNEPSQLKPPSNQPVTKEALTAMPIQYTSGLQSDKRIFHGVGLGLRLCQLLASLMRGEIGCSSTHPNITYQDGTGSGSTFWFEASFKRVLPTKSPIFQKHNSTNKIATSTRSPMLAQKKQGESRWQSASSLASEESEGEEDEIQTIGTRTNKVHNVRSGKLHFLVADDMKINRQILRTILHKLGHSIDEAVNGLEAVQMVQTNRYDLIFMDVRMPILGGREATLQIRSFPAYRNIPIVAIAGDVCGEDEKRSLDAGMNDVLSKPITRENVAKIIEKVLSH